MDSFTDLQAWQKGLQMTKEVYKLSGKFPRSEGFGRYTYADKAYKYTIARGECSEVYAFLLIALELGFISRNDTETALNLNGEVGRILSGLISSCRSQS